MSKGIPMKSLFLLILLFPSGWRSSPVDAQQANSESPALPNFVVIFTDDQGYGDLGCFGSGLVHTPMIDRMAKEGARLTSFYMAAPVCTPSRAALMTGCYPKRNDMATGSSFIVLFPGDPKGLHPDEITIAELLKTKGYATGIFGKWHLGDQPDFLPTRQGFDAFFGIPYSHDIHPFHPNPDWDFPPLPLFDGEQVIETDPDADYLTQRITRRSVKFIEKHRDEPFFLYIPHPMPHAPLHVSPPFLANVQEPIRELLAEEGQDTVLYSIRNQLYPQAISEIDWSVGQILETLRTLHLEKRTLVIFASDNGPGAPLASPGVLRGRKGSTWEGGMRVPAIAWWPGQIGAGTKIDEMLTAMDLLPTFAHLAGVKVPGDRVIDGRNIWPVLSGQPGAGSPHDRFFYYHVDRLYAVRSGPWKYHRLLPDESGPALYNLDRDPGESKDLSSRHPEIVSRLSAYLDKFEAEMGQGDHPGQHVRPAGWIEP